MILLLLSLAASATAFVKRAAVLESLDDAERAHFDATPDYATLRHVRSFVEQNPLGGRMEVRHEMDLSGACRSVDHEASIEALRCEPSDAGMTMRFVDGGAPPAAWSVGTVLLGSAAWRCATRAVPTDTSAVRFVDGEFEPFVRRIHAIERDARTGDWHFVTEPVQGTVCLLGSTIRMRTHKPTHMSVADYMTALEQVRRARCARARPPARACCRGVFSW